jgi:hypothetical protein
MTTDFALLKSELQEAFFSLYMDGRNENGTHLVAMPGDRIGDSKFCERNLDPREAQTEAIFLEAEKLGHKDGHCVVTIWRQDPATPDGEGYYWEFVRVSPVLTEAFFGNPDKQTAANLVTRT